MPPVRFEIATPPSLVKHSTIEPSYSTEASANQISNYEKHRTLVKSAQRKFNFLIPESKHMLLALKRTVFRVSKTCVKIDG